MKETKAYKTYLGYATRATPPKKARKSKKPASPQLTTVPVSPEEPTGKSKRVKRPAKKSTKAPARGVVIRETPEMPLKSKRDFHKTHPSSSGTVTKTAPSDAKIKSSVTRNDEDDNNNKQDSRSEGSDQENDSDDDKTQSDNENELDSEHATDKNELDETKITDKAEGDEDEKMDYTTSQLYDDVDIRLNKPVQADDETVKKEAINPQSALPNFASVFQFNNKLSALEKDVSEIKKDDPLKTQMIALVDEHLDARLEATKDEFMSYLSASITARITEQGKI
ncbi:hypothetical protein Tco_1468838 [Tanacetum coccineum]